MTQAPFLIRRTDRLAGALFAWAIAVSALGVLVAGHASANLRSVHGWYAYDYQAGLGRPDLPVVNVFHAGAEVGRSVWVDDSRWSIDDPESPPSVLALVRYDQWGVENGEVVTTATAGEDLRGLKICFDLQGRNLDLRGGHATFWVMSSTTGQRWHHVVPLVLENASPKKSGQFWNRPSKWIPQRVDMDGEWRNSWKWNTEESGALERVLQYANSYGVAFVGFEDEPTGELGMRNFRVGC